jgi:hypothetical protein
LSSELFPLLKTFSRGDEVKIPEPASDSNGIFLNFYLNGNNFPAKNFPLLLRVSGDCCKQWQAIPAQIPPFCIGFLHLLLTVTGEATVKDTML